jgi:hypothetical protein
VDEVRRGHFTTRGECCIVVGRIASILGLDFWGPSSIRYQILAG